MGLATAGRLKSRLGRERRKRSSDVVGPEFPLAGVEGLEPPTPGFGDRCSSQLSYTPSAERPLSTPASYLGSAALRCNQAGRRGAEASRDTDPHPQISSARRPIEPTARI